MQSTEQWLPVFGYEGRYEVSDAGRVRSLPGSFRSGKELRPVMVRRYQVVNLFDPNGRKQAKVHRIVCAAFHGSPPIGQTVVRHLNGDPLDNRPSNLSWGTDSENNTDTVLHGRHQNAGRTACARGHEYTAENTRHVLGESGRMIRQCRACGRIWAETQRARRKLATDS